MVSLIRGEKMGKEKLWCKECYKYTEQKRIDDKSECLTCGNIESLMDILIADPKNIELTEEIMRGQAEAWYRNKDKPFTI